MDLSINNETKLKAAADCVQAWDNLLTSLLARHSSDPGLEAGPRAGSGRRLLEALKVVHQMLVVQAAQGHGAQVPRPPAVVQARVVHRLGCLMVRRPA